jgi:hypothetical protein
MIHDTLFSGGLLNARGIIARVAQISDVAGVLALLSFYKHRFLNIKKSIKWAVFAP